MLPHLVKVEEGLDASKKQMVKDLHSTRVEMVEADCSTRIVRQVADASRSISIKIRKQL